MFSRLAAGLLAGASLAALVVPAEAGTSRPVRWNTGGAVWTTTSSEFKTFFSTGDITDRALSSGISNSGWTAEEIQEGMTKTYAVDIIGVSRFLYSDDGVKFLKDQTRSYFPYWKMKSTSVVALRSAIVADSIDGEISSAGIMAELPVDFRLADTCGTYDGIQNLCAPQPLRRRRPVHLAALLVRVPARLRSGQLRAARARTSRCRSCPSPLVIRL